MPIPGPVSRPDRILFRPAIDSRLRWSVSRAVVDTGVPTAATPASTSTSTSTPTPTVARTNLAHLIFLERFNTIRNNSFSAVGMTGRCGWDCGPHAICQCGVCVRRVGAPPAPAIEQLFAGTQPDWTEFAMARIWQQLMVWSDAWSFDGSTGTCPPTAKVCVSCVGFGEAFDRFVLLSTLAACGIVVLFVALIIIAWWLVCSGGRQSLTSSSHGDGTPTKISSSASIFRSCRFRCGAALMCLTVAGTLIASGLAFVWFHAELAQPMRSILFAVISEEVLYPSDHAFLMAEWTVAASPTTVS